MAHIYQATHHSSSLETLQEEAGAKNWWLSMPLAFLALGLGMLFSGLLSQWLIQPFINPSNQLVLGEVSTLLFPGISALSLLLVAKVWEHRSLASFGLWREKLGRNLLLGAAIGCLTTTAIFVVNALAGQLHFRLGNQFNLALWPYLLLMIFLEALAEEVIYRGFVLNKLRTKMGLVPAIALGNLFFGLMHTFKGGAPFSYILSVTLSGVLFSLLFALTDNLWLVAATHALYNLTLTNIFGLVESGPTFLRTTLSSDSNPLLVGTAAIPVVGGILEPITMTLICLFIAYLVKKKADAKAL